MLKRILMLALASALIGCASPMPLPGVNLLPQPPATLAQKCDPLSQIPSTDATKGEALEVTVENYKKANTCSAKVDGWIGFYNDLVEQEKKRNKK